MPIVSDGAGGEVHEPMPGEELLAIRRTFGLRKVQFGQLLGLTGENRNIYNTITRYEDGRRPISPLMERTALLLSWFYADHGYIPDLDKGERGARLAVEPREAANGGCHT